MEPISEAATVRKGGTHKLPDDWKPTPNPAFNRNKRHGISVPVPAVEKDTPKPPKPKKEAAK